MAFPSGGYTSSASAATDGLIHYLDFNEASGTSINDLMASGTESLDCTINNDVADSSIITGKFGNARDFGAQSNGVEVYRDNNSNATSHNTFTLSFWFKLTNQGVSSIYMMQFSGSTILYINFTGNQHVYVNFSTAQVNNSGYTWNDSAWHHFLMDHDGSGYEVFIDNISMGTAITASNLYLYDLFALCYNDTDAGIAFDDFAIWNRALTATERGYIYNSGTGQEILPFTEYREDLSESINITSTGESDPVQIVKILSETLDISETALDPPYAKLLVDGIIASTSSPTNAVQNLINSENVQIQDLYSLAFDLSLLDAIQGSDNAVLIKKLLNSLVETINVSEDVINNFYPDEVLEETTNLSDNLLRFFELLLTEAVDVSHTLTVEPSLYNSLVEAINISDSTLDNYGFSVVVEEDIDIADTSSPQSVLNRVLEEGLAFLNFNIGINGDTYNGWVMNPETFSVWNYEDFNFNSFAKFNNIPLGANSSGIYSLDSTTDDGTYIEAKLTTAALDFGSRHIKQVPLSYMGMTSDGKIVLKVRVDNKADVWYEITPVEDYEHTRKIPIGKGLIGRNWQFEIVTIDNSSLDIENMEFYPVIFKRKL